MIKLRLACTLVLGVLAFCLSGAAAADHGHGRSHVGVGIVVDPFWFGAWTYPGPYYYLLITIILRLSWRFLPRHRSISNTTRARHAQTSAYGYYGTQPPGCYPHVEKCPWAGGSSRRNLLEPP